ncbi:TlpA family protein disulfide reductase [Myxococcota bacterium]
MAWSLPRSLRVLIEPGKTFAEILANRQGYGALFGFLALELLLIDPLAVVSHLMRMSFNPGVAVWGLLREYLHFALPTGVGVLVLGLVLYYAMRARGRRLDPWTAASVIAYAWVPHLLLVAVSATVAGFGVDHVLMPHHRLVGSPLSGAAYVAKGAFEFAPSIVWIVMGVRACTQEVLPVSRHSPMSKILPIGSVLLLLLAFGTAGNRVWRDWRDVRPLMPGDGLPPFTLRGVEGAGLHHAELAHQVVLLDFWATWCPPCVSSMPHLEQLHRDFGASGFRLVSVNADEDAETIRRFVSQKELTFPVYVDPGPLRARFRVDSLPTAYLVDRHGKVRQVYVGDLSPASVRQDIQKLLSEPDGHG